MKSCPMCNRTYEDLFSFCLVDGAVLSPPFDSQKAQITPDIKDDDPQKTEILPLQRDIKTEPMLAKSTLESKLVSGAELKTHSKNINLKKLIVSAGIAITILFSVVIFLNISFRNKNTLTAKNQDSVSVNTTNTNQVSSTPDVKPSPQSTITNEENNQNINTSATPIPSPTPNVINISGTSWRANDGTTINFNSGNRFSGVGPDGDRTSGTWNQTGNKVHMSFNYDEQSISGNGTINGNKISMSLIGTRGGKVIQRVSVTMRMLK